MGVQKDKRVSSHKNAGVESEPSMLTYAEDGNPHKPGCVMILFDHRSSNRMTVFRFLSAYLSVLYAPPKL